MDLYIHLYIYTYIHISEVGTVSPTAKSYSFRPSAQACERAGEAGAAVWGRETMLLLWLGGWASSTPLVSICMSCSSLGRVLNLIVCQY